MQRRTNYNEFKSIVLLTNLCFIFAGAFSSWTIKSVKDITSAFLKIVTRCISCQQSHQVSYESIHFYCRCTMLDLDACWQDVKKQQDKMTRCWKPRNIQQIVHWIIQITVSHTTVYSECKIAVSWYKLCVNKACTCSACISVPVEMMH